MMGRDSICIVKDGGVRKGAWSAKEDELLSRYVNLLGEGKWRNLAQKAGLSRSGKSCRLRWLNYLRPGIKRGDFSTDEEQLILKLHRLLGNRWALIAGRLPGRTDNEVKNYWNTVLIKKVQGQQGSDSGLTIRKFQAEDKKVVHEFSWRNLQQIPGQAKEFNFLTGYNNVGASNTNNGGSSRPSLQIDRDQDDDKSLIAAMDVSDTNNMPLISDAFHFDYSYKASEELEIGDQKPDHDPRDLQHTEMKKIPSLLDIENELRELL